MYAFLNASLEGGFNLFADMVSLESLIERSRLVITGETEDDTKFSGCGGNCSGCSGCR